MTDISKQLFPVPLESCFKGSYHWPHHLSYIYLLSCAWRRSHVHCKTAGKKKTRAEGNKQDNQSITRSTMHAHQVTDQISLFLLFLDVLHQARGFCPSELRCQRKATPKMPEHFVCGQAFQSKELLNQLWRNYIHTGEVN